jgi:glucosamine-6-phosphate deaminase
MTSPAPFQPEVRVLPDAAAAVPILLDELRQAVGTGGRPLLGFATGGTYAAMLQALAPQLAAGRPAATAFTATHLDEYIGFGPQRRGGMVHELVAHCPPFGAMLARGDFLPVPSDGGASGLQAHEAALAALGGVALQFLGIGRNGHLAFNEPGTPLDLGFHVAELAASTRADARPRFQPAPVPTHAATAGLRTILGARRLVLCAFGGTKAAAVRAMLRDPPSSQCPAAAIRSHPRALVLLDPAAAG